jgi:hypothetical protein
MNAPQSRKERKGTYQREQLVQKGTWKYLFGSIVGAGSLANLPMMNISFASTRLVARHKHARST